LNIKDKLINLLSRKFLSPIIAVIAFIIWKQWLTIIPIDIYALFIGALCGGYLALEGIKDIIVAIAKTSKR